MTEYKFDEILESLKFDPRQINYAIMLIVGRLVHPASERETARWLRENSGLLELLQTDIEVYDNIQPIAIQIAKLRFFSFNNHFPGLKTDLEQAMNHCLGRGE